MESAVERRRRLRRDQTPAEARLWSELRGRRCGGCKFRRQHSIGPYVADFFCAQHRLVIEVDGQQHHVLSQQGYDRSRTAHLEQLGIRVLRFSNRAVLYEIGRVLEAIRRECTAPSDSLSTCGEGRGEE